MNDPIKQNKIHIKRLSEILNINLYLSCYHNLVVFLKRTNVSNIDSKYVCSVENLEERLILKKDILSEERVREIKKQFDNFLYENMATEQEFEKFHIERKNKDQSFH